MNPEELSRQILKFKSRKKKTRLAGLCTFISLFISLSTFAGDINISGLITFILTLPLPLYFFFQYLKLSRKARVLKSKLARHHHELNNLTPIKFSLTKFFTQPNFSFRLSLALVILIIFTTFARARVESTTISYQPQTIGQN